MSATVSSHIIAPHRGPLFAPHRVKRSRTVHGYHELAPVRTERKLPTGFEATTVLAAAVAIWLLWSILSPILGLSLIVSSSPSLEPQIPTGSIALIHTVPASAVSVGDLVIVSPVGSDGLVARQVAAKATPLTGTRSDILNLDSTGAAAGTNYVVANVGTVVFSIPELGKFLSNLATPMVVVLVLALLAVMTKWARTPQGAVQRVHRTARFAHLH